ncbi:MAG: hypothetical protein Rubg2KO_20970 [Rubricoccaceae bacterium]
MNRFLRQLVVPAVLTVALATGAMAQADSVAVVTFGPDGFSIQAPDDVPVGEGKAVMLRRMDDNGWAMTTLQPGDIPSEVAESMPRSSIRFAEGAFPGSLRARDSSESAYALARSARSRAQARMPRLSSEVVDVFEIEAQRSVLFEVTAQYNLSEMDDALVDQLTENEALRRLEVSDEAGHGALDARFVFDSVEEWNEWKAASETEAMLDALRDATREMRTRMEVRQ